jgi:MFS family permease
VRLRFARERVPDLDVERRIRDRDRARSRLLGSNEPSRGLPTVGVGAVWAVVGVASTVGTLAIGTVLHTRLGRFAAALALALGALGSLLAIGPALPWAFASAVFLGLGGWTAPPSAFTAFARHRTSAQTYPAAYASITTALALGQFAGPLIGSAVVARGGLVAATTLGAAIYVLASLSALLDAAIASRVTSPAGKRLDREHEDSRIDRRAEGCDDAPEPELASVVIEA